MWTGREDPGTLTPSSDDTENRELQGNGWSDQSHGARERDEPLYIISRVYGRGTQLK